MKTLTGVLLGLLVGGVLLAGCGSEPDAKVVGASLLTQTHVFYQDMVVAMEEEGKKQGLTLRIQYAEFDSSKQNNQVETFLIQGVDALLVAPVDSAGIKPVIADAHAKNVPVFTVDIAAHGAQVVSHIASDNKKGGALLADYMAKLLGEKGKIAIIDHPSVASVQDRTAGFEESLAKYPDMSIVRRVPGEGQRDKAFRAAQDLLQATSDLDGIFAINDDSALGALAALQAAGLDEKIVVLGFDGTPEACEQIRKGSALKADAVQYPKQIGRTTIQTIAASLRGEAVPAEVPVDVQVIDQASLAAQ